MLLKPIALYALPLAIAIHVYIIMASSRVYVAT